MSGSIGHVIGFRAAAELGDPEIRHLHPPVPIHQNVARLDVAMHHSAVVRELDRIADLRNQLERQIGDHAAALDQAREIRPVDVFHREKEPSVALAEFMDRHDPRMIERRQGLRLTLETLAEASRGIPLIRQDLERDKAVQTFLPRLEHRAHAASSHQFHNLKFREIRGHFLNPRHPGRTGGVALHSGFPIQIHQRVHESIRLIVRGKQRLNLTPQRRITPAGFVKIGGARPRVRQFEGLLEDRFGVVVFLHAGCLL